MAFEFKDRYDINDLREIMTLLRSENGCPWDRVQTHDSIRTDFIEETYEVLQALDNNDTENLKEELGDVLLQVVFHSEIEREAGTFDFDDVCNDVCQKLVIRHPHVFADVSADTPEEVLKNWEAIKAETKGRKKAADSIESIPRALPALIRSRKVQKKAADYGFDWSEVSGALDKVSEELVEVSDAIAEGDQAHIDEELGDLLFAVVNVSRFTHTDAEQALTAATDKFAARFIVCEKLAQERGIDMKQCTLEELDKLWDEAKIILAK